MFSHSVFLLLTVLHMCVHISCNSCIQGCTCTRTLIACTCPDDQPLFFTPNLIDNRATKVKIHDCDEVHLYPWNSVFVHPLHSFNISRVRNLIFTHNVFSQVRNMHDLIIAHVDMVNFTSDSISGIERIHRIHLIDVSAEQIPPNTFRDLNHVGELTLVNCSIQIVHQSAFTDCNNLTRFALINFTVDILQNQAINLTNVDRFTMEVNVKDINTSAIVLANVGKVSIRSSVISNIHSEFLAVYNATSISLRHNLIDHVNPYAFAQLNNVEQLEVAHNVFDEASKDSLFIDSVQVMETHFNGNQFTCSSDICWLLDKARLDEFYNHIINNSTCFAPPPMRGKHMRAMDTLTDDADVCGDDVMTSSGDFSTVLFAEKDLIPVTSPPDLQGSAIAQSQFYSYLILLVFSISFC